jgi:two-component system chemotaxis response regulator CheB
MAVATPNGRDIIVIGSSAGGIQALPRLLRALPPELPASMFICQHIARTSNPQLVSILSRATPIPVSWAEQGERIRPNRIYVAPPDLHLTFTDHHVRLAHGPRENYARPSIDRLFRSAAVFHGGRSIAVLLTGMMDDGVAGAVAIQEAGGRVIVQDPSDAAFPELPESALAAMTPDALLAIDRIGTALVEMTMEPPIERAPSDRVILEHELDVAPGTPSELDQLGPRVAHNCPECSGSLWSVGSRGAPRFRCYLGHVVTARELLAQSEEQVEAALWNAVRALYERASTLDTLASDARTLASPGADEYQERAQKTRTQAEIARQFLLDLGRRVPKDAPKR